MERIEALLADLHDELIDAVQPLEERVVALASTLARVEAAASRPLPVPAPADPRPPAIDPGTAALVASAASALARLEARMEAEFRALHRELDAVRTLVAAADHDDDRGRRPRLRVFRRSA